MGIKVNSLVDRLKQNESIIRKEIDEAISAIFEENPEIQNIYVVGTTPGFNDGEPCTHSQQFCFNAREIQDEDDNTHVLITELPDEESYDDFINYDHERNYNENENQPEPNILEAAELIRSLENHFEFLYETNFQILFSRNSDGTYATLQGDASCGY